MNKSKKLGVAAFAGLLAVGTLGVDSAFADHHGRHGNANQCGTKQKAVNSQAAAVNEVNVKAACNTVYQCRTYHEARTSNCATQNARKTGVDVLEQEIIHGDATYSYFEGNKP